MGLGGDDFKVQVMMVGGRRCGKTSVLAAMKSNFEDRFAKTKLTFSYGNSDTLDILEEKRNEINEYFQDAGNRTFIPDSNPTEEMQKYSFSVGIAEKRGKIKIDFVDYPGEWLMDKVHRQDLVKCMRESRVIIVAIDTPYMMEEEGRYNENRNHCHRTGEMLKLAFEEANVLSNLILFVPLKCERYLVDGRIEEVREKTIESYKELIHYFKRTPDKYEVAVTPIFTLGDAMFSHFERDDETMDIILNGASGTPEKAIYYFPDTAVKESHPQYCEQPLVYLLVYLMQSARNTKSNEYNKGFPIYKGFLLLQQFIFRTTSADDYDEQMKTLMRALKKSGDGYRILQNPMQF